MPDPTPAPAPLLVSTKKAPPPPVGPPAQHSSSAYSFTSMSIDGVDGGAALIGISMSETDDRDNGRNVHVVLKSSSRNRLTEVLERALADLKGLRTGDVRDNEDPVYLHLSLDYLMKSARSSPP